MLFKGTSTCTAAQLAQRMDAIGGQINAFTTKENTCFHARCLDTHLQEALDILCDMFFDSKFAEEDVQTERGVILEEIGMYADDPADLVSERLFSAVFHGTALGRPILGRKATLNQMTGAWLKQYQQEHYTADRVVVTLAGSFDDAILECIRDRFSAMHPGKARKLKPVSVQDSIVVKKKATEQNHLLVAFPSITDRDPRKYQMQLLSSILGGGMSSRLFQQVRERNGLCYSIYTFGTSHEEVGLLSIYTALNREQEPKAIACIRNVLDEFLAHGPTPEELDLVREQSKANVLMGLESTTARMSHLARCLLREGYFLTPDDIIAAYDAVTREEVLQLARETFDFDHVSFSAVGRTADAETYRALLSGTGTI
jgi:predicted Zn-dependent peptidase